MFYTSASLSRMDDRAGRPWRGTLEYRDERGCRRQVRKVFAGVRLKREAEAALRDWRDEMEARAGVREYGKTLAVAVETYLEEQLALGQISRVTYQNSLRMARKAVFPVVGELLFAEVTAGDVQGLVGLLARKYKPQSVRTIFATLSKTFKEGLRRGEVLCDPTSSTSLPRVVREEPNSLDAEGRARFFGEMGRDCPFYLPTMIAYYTGMRAGEVCALTWRDVDFDAGSIHVRRAAKEYRDVNGDACVEVSHTKTARKRTIPLMPQLRDILLERRAGRGEWVVEQRNPRLLCTSFLKWATRHRVLGRTGKPLTMHGLRHNFATLGVQSGMDVKSLSAILGHSSAAMTLDVYASSDEGAKRCAMDVLGKLMEAQEAERVQEGAV